MENDALFDPPPAADTAPPAASWTTVTRKKVTTTVEDEFAAAEPIIQAGQRDFFPCRALYRWVWTPDTGWQLSLCEISGPNRKANGQVGLMTVTERLHGAASELWARLPDWLYLAMVASRPDWEPPAAQLTPAEGAVEAVLQAADEPRVRADDDLERERP